MGNRSFLKRILATYLCVMLIPMACGIIVYEYIMSKNTERVIGVLENSFENNIDGINADLTVIESTAESIAFNPEFSNFFNSHDLADRNISTNELIGLRKLLASYQFDREIASNMFIYSKRLNLLLDSSDIYHNPSEFFRDKYSVETENVQETLTRITSGNESKYVSRVKSNNKYVKYPVIEFQKSVPIAGDEKEGFVTFIIKSEDLFSSFGKVIEESRGYIEIYYDDTLLFNNGTESGKEDSYSFSLSQGTSKWRYEISIPEDYVMKDTRTMNMFLLLVNAIAFIIGSLLCVYFAMKKVRAYRDIIFKMDLVGSAFEPGKGDEIEKIGRFINELVNDKDEAEQELLEQKRIGNMYECVQKLLFGDYKSSEEAQYAINENGVAFEGNKYAVLLFSFENGIRNLSEEMNIKSFIQTSMSEFAGDLVYTYYIDSYNVAAILSYDGEEDEFTARLKNVVSSVKVDLVYKHNINVHVGVGKIVQQLTEISQSLSCAEEVVNYVKILGEEKVVLYSEIPSDGDSCYYNTETEENIIKYVSVRDGEKAAEILKDIKEKNLTERALSLSSAKKLATRIETTMIKLNEKTESKTDFSFEKKSLSELFDYAAEYVKIVASSLETTTEKRSDVLHNEIVEYVRKNYADYELSLEKLSARFNLNVAYTSTIFRKKTGDTFLHFVEQLRIKKACEMILTSEYKISEIAQAVGYTNDTSFRRSFKRITGISPSQYYAENLKNTQKQ